MVDFRVRNTKEVQFLPSEPPKNINLKGDNLVTDATAAFL